MTQTSFNQNDDNKLPLDDVIRKVTNMVSWDSTANILAKQNGLDIDYVSWEGTYIPFKIFTIIHKIILAHIQQNHNIAYTVKYHYKQ